MKFNLEKIKQNKTVVNCKTEEQAKVLLEFLRENGITWKDKTHSSTLWYDEKEKTCYNVDGIYLSYDSNEYFLNKDYTILEFEDVVVRNKPNISEILGVDVEQLFNIKGIACNPCKIQDNTYYVVDRNNEVLHAKHLLRAINDTSLVEKIEYNDEQKEIFRALKVLGFNWIARDSNCCIYTYESKPVKSECKWRNNGDTFIELETNKILNQPHLNFIDWEDEEPFEIPEV